MTTGRQSNRTLLGKLAVTAALLAPAFAARGQQPPPGVQVGDVYEIRWESEWRSRGPQEGSSGSSNSRNMLVERVVAVRDDGVELEFDLPEETTADERARTWQYPARVFRPLDGPLQLRNGAELEARVERWLEAAGLPREACGRWIFTWTAIQIACDPQSVVETLAALDLSFCDLRDRAVHQEPGGRGPVIVTREARGSDGATVRAAMDVDPDAVRRQRAEIDIVVAEISGRSLTLDAALQAQSRERISGTLTLACETDSAARVQRKTKVTELAIEAPGGSVETQTTTETLERRLVPRAES